MSELYEINPYIIANLRNKSKAKIGSMIIDIVRNNPKKNIIGIKNIVAMGRKYHIGNKTIARYLKKSIFYYGEKKTKIFILREKEVEFCREIIKLEERFNGGKIEEIEIFKILIIYLGKKL